MIILASILQMQGDLPGEDILACRWPMGIPEWTCSFCNIKFINLNDIEVRLMKSESRFSSGKQKVLENCEGSFGTLIDVETATDKKEMIQKIRTDFGEYFKNEKFVKLKEAPLDIAIFLEVNLHRYKTQDLDNIQKIVLDALEKDDAEPSWNYLYKNDSQVCRILVWKIEKKMDSDYNTASMTISFRIHDPSKQMIMVSNRDDLAQRFDFL